MMRVIRNAISRTLRVRLGEQPPDAWLSQWGCTFGGLALTGLASSTLWTHAASRLELILGVAAAVLVAMLFILLGALARQVHLAVWAGRAPWRSRRAELLSHAVGLGILGFGGWAVSSASPGLASAVTGGLLVLGAYVVVLCLGCWSTVVGSMRDPLSTVTELPLG
jgi:hypothetical protein